MIERIRLVAAGNPSVIGWRTLFQNAATDEVRITVPHGRQAAILDLPLASDPDFEFRVEDQDEGLVTVISRRVDS